MSEFGFGGFMCRPIRANEFAALDGVIRFQHRRKISSILIRNTVVPIAIRTTLGSCLAIEGVRKPGVVMSIIPLDVQRRCERRWAARFSRPDGIGRTSKPAAGIRRSESVLMIPRQHSLSPMGIPAIGIERALDVPVQRALHGRC